MMEITPIKNLDAEISVQGSKYAANRLLAICSLADGKSELGNMPVNEDIKAAIKALRNFGAKIEFKDGKVLVHGGNGILNAPKRAINVGDSGTLMRFVAAIASIAKGETHIIGSERVKARRMEELLGALQKLGVDVKSSDNHLPVAVQGGNLKGGAVKISGLKSSQFISALLIIAPLAKHDTEIIVEDKMVSKEYVDLTIDLMKKCGVDVGREGYQKFIIKAGQGYKPVNLELPMDWSSANYFFAGAAITNGKIRVANASLDFNHPESKFIEILRDMGCKVNIGEKSLEVQGASSLKPVNADMSSMPDSAQTLAAVSVFADGAATISNIHHLADKESNRIKDTAMELKKIGANVAFDDNNLTIKKSALHGGTINPHNDHRMAMSFALIGLRIDGIKITNPKCVNKSFPDFWDKLKSIGVVVKNA